MKNSSKIYLSNLNSIRAIAAFLVIVSHIERQLQYFNITSNIELVKIGPVGVTLFFCLSGFLITYLLLIEKDLFNKINIKDFYIRRFLRIWPLYYILLLFVYLLIPYLLPEYYLQEKDRFTAKSALLNVFFLTNVTMILKYTPLIISIIWSIGIEEQFYLFWPWIVKSYNLIKNIIFIILLLPILKIVLLLLSYKIENLKIIYDILNLTRFDSMAIGGLFGVLALKKSFTINNITIKDYWFKGTKIQLIIYPLTIFSLIYLVHFDLLFNVYNFQILPFLFSIILLNLVDTKNSIFNLENKLFNYLGKISYSLYLLHFVFFYLFHPILRKWIDSFDSINLILKTFIVYFVSIIGSIIISLLSYELIEKRFLSYKKYFTHVKSGEN